MLLAAVDSMRKGTVRPMREGLYTQLTGWIHILIELLFDELSKVWTLIVQGLIDQCFFEIYKTGYRSLIC